MVGTASLRRAAQLRAVRPDLAVVPLRGNVQTRLRKLDAGEVQATFLAMAGLVRLGLEAVVSAALAPEEMLPAVAQGAIGIECRADDDAGAGAARTRSTTPPTMTAITAERAFLAVLDGSCRTPIAALAELDGDALRLARARRQPRRPGGRADRGRAATLGLRRRGQPSAPEPAPRISVAAARLGRGSRPA